MILRSSNAIPATFAFLKSKPLASIFACAKPAASPFSQYASTYSRPPRAAANTGRSSAASARESQMILREECAHMRPRQRMKVHAVLARHVLCEFLLGARRPVQKKRPSTWHWRYCRFLLWPWRSNWGFSIDWLDNILIVPIRVRRTKSGRGMERAKSRGHFVTCPTPFGSPIESNWGAPPVSFSPVFNKPSLFPSNICRRESSESWQVLSMWTLLVPNDAKKPHPKMRRNPTRTWTQTRPVEQV